MAPPVAQRINPTTGAVNRTLDEHLIVRFPGAYGRFARLLSALPPRSRFRQYVLRRQISSSLAAVSRGDIEAWLTGYTPDAVHEWSSGFVSLGFPERAVGRPALFDAMSEWDATWERWTMTPHFIIDLGDTIVSLNRIAGRSVNAGVDVEIDQAGVIDIKGGLVSKERDFNDWSGGLRAAGLDPDVLPRLNTLLAGERMELGGLEPPTS